MEKNKNIIYVNDNFYDICNERQRNKILMIAEKRFKSRDIAEQWMQTNNDILQIWPDIMLGTYPGYCLVLNAISREKIDWSRDEV